MSRRGAFLLAVGLAFIGFVFYSLFTVSPVRVLSTHLERANGQVFVKGVVENYGSRPASVDVEVHYYDHGGHQLADEKLSLDDLKPGVRTGFRSRSQAIDGVSSFSLYVNHGRNPYGN
jgi:hypothetical protein